MTTQRILLPYLGVWGFNDNVNILLIVALLLAFVVTSITTQLFSNKMKHIEERLLELETRRKDKKKKSKGAVPRSKMHIISEMLRPSSPFIYKKAAIGAMAGSTTQPKFIPGGLENMTQKDLEIFGSAQQISELKKQVTDHAQEVPLGIFEKLRNKVDTAPPGTAKQSKAFSAGKTFEVLQSLERDHAARLADEKERELEEGVLPGKSNQFVD